jgi:hypothetical protein
VVINEKDLGLQKGVTFNNRRIEKMVRKENNQAAIQSHKFGNQSKFSLDNLEIIEKLSFFGRSRGVFAKINPN